MKLPILFILSILIIGLVSSAYGAVTTNNASVCKESECGPKMGAPNYLCPNGKSWAGQTGRCLNNSNGKCGWEVLTCPAENTTNQSVTDSKEGSNNHSLNNSRGIGQNLSQGIAEKRTEYRSGNFTTSLGQFLNVKEIVAGMLELREGNVSVNTTLKLIKVENNESKLEVELSNGRKAEIKIMPSTASQTAIARLVLKVCNESNNCTIELKEVGKGNQTRVVYETHVERHYRILGIFSAKAENQADVDAETGTVSINQPWWASISTKQD